MAIKSADQISIVDVTDAYSVILTSEAHTFAGSTSAAKAGSTTTQIIALRGAEQMQASVVVAEITKPSGVTVSSDGNATAPTLTITVSTSVTSGGTIKIPVHVGDITITKEFTFAIAFTGEKGASGTSITIKSQSVTYQTSTSGTTTPTGTWGDSVPTVSNGHYLWTKTEVVYSDNTKTVSYSVSYKGTNGSNGSNGSSVTVTSTSVTYATSTSGTTAPSSGWGTTVPSVAKGQFLWTKTYVKYSDGKETTSYSVSYAGTNGTNGVDAITMSVTSSNGTIFKNSSIATVLTAHVYKAGVELNDSQIASLGTVKWYKDGGTTAVATGTSYTIDAGDVKNKATFIAQLEG